MKAIGYQKTSPIIKPDSLHDIELPKPSAAGNDILVKVAAISVNPVDTKIRRKAEAVEGEYKVLGWDAVGVVEAVGNDVTLFAVGDKVWYAGAINRQGTNMEYHLVDERIVAKMPNSLSVIEAAALPLTSITAWEMLFERLQISKSETGSLLIIGAAGGVGSIMIQLAKQLTNLTIIATASRPETISWVKKMGADFVIDHHQDFTTQLDAHGVKDIKYIASLNHTDAHVAEIVKVIAPQGHLVLIDDPEHFDIMPFKTKSIAIHWELMFTRSLFNTEDILEQQKLLTEVAALVDSGKIKSTMVENLGMINATNLIKAHGLLESGKSIGKIVLSGFD